MEWLHQAGLIVGAVVIPLAAFIINILARASRHVVQSSAADLLLVLLVLDGNLLISSAQAAPMVHSEPLQAQFTPLVEGLGAIGMVIWAISVLYLERSFALGFDAHTGEYTHGFPYWSFGLCWSTAAAMATLHVLLFFIQI